MKRLVILTVLALCLAGCGENADSSSPEISSSGTVSEQSYDYVQISQEEASEIMKAETCIILDVRTQEEFSQGHIPGAICIPNEEITTDPPAGLPDKDALILVYCRSGRRSKEAAAKLAAMGYTDIREFGGIITWTGEVTEAE
ncbi:MAG: rhodanese-like domain-containing protein [Ruminococcus sp.]|nr:rhodanese-like domain-containing protein [Ruminococcus sp.]